MAKLPSAFNSDDHDEMSDFSVLPKGDYLVKITASDYVPNSKKTGHILKLTREIVSGEFKGRKIFRNLNLDNPNPVAVEIANKEFTSTCKACGVVAVEDTEELHGIEHMISLTVKKGSGDQPDSNEVSSIKPLEGAAKPSTPGASAKSASKPSQTRKKPIFDDEDEGEESED